MPKLIRIIILLIAAAILPPLVISYPEAYAQDEFLLVESVPAETVLENSGLPRTADVWNEAFINAKSSIDIETFYFADQPGKPLEKIINTLKESASRGVKIRIIVDSSFYANNDKSVDLLENTENIKIRKIPMRNIAGGVMHAKFFVVDGEYVFLGSQNFDWRALMHIHEIGALVRNKRLAGTFSAIFQTDWDLCEHNMQGLLNTRLNSFVNSENPVLLSDEVYGEMEIYPAVSPPDHSMQGLDSELSELLRIINSAEISLNIQVYSYSKGREEPDFTAVDDALRNAGKRGVKVRMILPDWAMRKTTQKGIKELSTAENVQVRISSIPLYSEGFIPYARVDHCKYFTADQTTSWISTTNWEESYFKRSRNISLIVKGREVNNRLNEVFERSWDSPYAAPVDVNREYEEVKRN